MTLNTKNCKFLAFAKKEFNKPAYRMISNCANEHTVNAAIEAALSFYRPDIRDAKRKEMQKIAEQD